jgi:hypothetical protein
MTMVFAPGWYEWSRDPGTPMAIGSLDEAQ